MIIILEGIDAVGKTSIAKQLVTNAKERDAIPYTYVDETFKHLYNFHSESEKGDYFVTGFNAQTMNIFLNFDGFIKDRFHLSEHVFSKFMKRSSPLPFEKLDGELSKLKKDILVVYLTTTYETYLKRISGNESKEIYIGKEDEFEELQKLFVEAYDTSKLMKVQISTDSLTIKEISNQIDERIFTTVPCKDFGVRR